MTDWKLYDPDYTNPMTVNLFDDGISNYKDYENIWYVCGDWKGKIRLINIDKKTLISSISTWKVREYESNNEPN